MRTHLHLLTTLGLGLLLAWTGGTSEGQPAAALPQGVRPVWELGKAQRETTATRERVCVNGLWQWQPARGAAEEIPTEKWGYFKVPGCWPGITDYMQKDSQAVHSHPDWRNERMGSVTSAWYQREISVPAEWGGRRIALSVECLNSYAAVYVDGKKAGELRFPGGELDITAACRPGGKHVLSMLVVAMPLKAVMQSYTDSAAAREVKGSVARRGLCGDAWLVGTPTTARVGNVRVETSTRKWEIKFDTALEGIAAEGRYALRARIMNNGHEIASFMGNAFRGSDVGDGHAAFTARWKPESLWDLHTPKNQYEVEMSLLDGDGKVLDAGWTQRFGFREFWIDGRDFYLNGSRVFLSAVPLDNALVGAAWAGYEGARESMERLKSFGINFVYTHNYGCEPGSHLSYAEVLRAADDAGMLVSFTQPHFSHYDWKAADADRNNGYARHAESYARAAGSHPSVVFYSMSHNATGYSEDMNPDMIDGIQDPRDQWAMNNSKLAVRAEAIVKRLDPGRIVYHHASGNLGSLHASNFYVNFAPVQELSDWFEHWATKGVKPMFTCEYGVPFTWDWTMYRGWYKGQREFGSAKVPWDFCLAEWNSQFLGDGAFASSEAEKANLRWEAKQFRIGNGWYRWDYPNQVGSPQFDERYAVFAMYLVDNWRAFRTWGLSANSPWEYGHYWKLRTGVNRGRKELKVDWEALQRPGLSADYIEQRYERMDLAYEASDWVATAAAQALVRNNRPVLAYIGGKPAAFTSKDHNFRAGETVEKQVIVINNSRVGVTCECEWSLGLPQRVAGSTEVTVATGEQARIPLRFELPAGLAPGRYELKASVKFSNGESQADSFWIDVLPGLVAAKVGEKIALLDPKGETGKWLDGIGISYQRVEASADLSKYDTLIVGKGAMTVDGPGPELGRVREGLKAVVFEQTSEVLERRLGFRVEEYGLRQVFRRVPNHPLLAGLTEDQLRDWRGEATILPPRLRYEMRPRYGPTVKWCDIPVTRAWRCGNRGSVASVLIEKPARGDFRPILDGGYSLQYSPLMEYREGKGMVLFCQMDVTGRTENDPAAELLGRNILQYMAAWKPSPTRKTVYVGELAGKAHLESVGVAAGSYDQGPLAADAVLVVGSGGAEKLAGNAAIGEWIKAGGNVLAIGLDEKAANAFLPFKVAMRKGEHIAAHFEAAGAQSLLAGVGPADVHNRDPRELPLVSGGDAVIGNGVLAQAEKANVVFCQLAPWQFGPSQQYNLKRTHRRTSFLVSRLLGNMGVGGSTPVLARFGSPVNMGKPEQRWLEGFYVDQPEEWDDPYRFFRW